MARLTAASRTVPNTMAAAGEAAEGPSVEEAAQVSSEGEHDTGERCQIQWRPGVLPLQPGGGLQPDIYCLAKHPT